MSVFPVPILAHVYIEGPDHRRKPADPIDPEHVNPFIAINKAREASARKTATEGNKPNLASSDNIEVRAEQKEIDLVSQISSASIQDDEVSSES